MKPDVKPELTQMISNISQKSMFYGTKIPASIMAMFTLIETDFNCGVLAPFWLSVLQVGRGPRKSTTDSKLVNKIYAWMAKRNMFKSKTKEGKFNEAKFMTWWINKHGNKHFNSRRFVDIYATERKLAIDKINVKYSNTINQLTINSIYDIKMSIK